MTGLLLKLLGWLGSAFSGRRRVRVTVHRALFSGSKAEAYFINVTNLSSDRAVEITHVWFETDPPTYALPPDRPLPKRLSPDESWETWILVKDLRAWVHETAFKVARVRLSTHQVVKSVENRNVPAYGYVPGGPIKNENDGKFS